MAGDTVQDNLVQLVERVRAVENVVFHTPLFYYKLHPRSLPSLLRPPRAPYRFNSLVGKFVNSFPYHSPIPNRCAGIRGMFKDPVMTSCLVVRSVPPALLLEPKTRDSRSVANQKF